MSELKDKKRYGIIATIGVITLVALLVTYSFLPVFLREKGGLHRSFEKAQWYLENDRYSDLTIEYDYAPDAVPTFKARGMLIQRMEQYCEKDSIEDVLDDQISFNDIEMRYTEQYVQMLTEKYSDLESRDDRLVLHVFYLNGEWKQDNVLGLSYGGTNIVIFEEQIRSVASQSRNLSPADIESSVLVHEFGHILGLVGIDYNSDHNIEGHHCDESQGDCVMAASVEVRMGGFSQKPPTDFCPLCQDDISDIRVMEDGWSIEEYLTSGVMIGELVIGVSWIAVFMSESSKDEKELYQEHYGNDFQKKGGKKLY